MLLAGLLLALNTGPVVEETPQLDFEYETQDAPNLPLLDELTDGGGPQQGGSCPANAPLLCDNAYCWRHRPVRRRW